jgi:methyl-accepting chemotaxis protein
MKLADLKITFRLYLAFGVIVLILAILVTMAELGFKRQDAASAINVHTYEVLDRGAGVLESLLNIETGQRGFSLTGKDGSLEPYSAGKTSFQANLRALTELTSDNPKQQERLKQLGEKQQEWLTGAVEPAIALRRQGGDGDAMAGVVANEQSNKGKAAMDRMRQLLSDITTTERDLLKQRTEQAALVRSQTERLIIGGGLAAAALAALLAFLLGKNISTPLGAAVALAQRVARGDLSSNIEVHGKDEIGQLMLALREMNTALTSIVHDVREGTNTITTAASEISAGNMDLSSRTEQQASSLEETASSMEELTSTVKQNAASASQARELAGTASGVAVRGGELVAEVVATMGTINDSARKIADIIGVIDGIAFQTNILALNAAVEAARAGEQGRGFAVVASEVRNLAQRSASAAKEIKTLIDDSVNKVDAGSKLVDRAGATMEEVVTSVRSVAELINDIATASEEQRNGIEQVNDAINQMDQVTQQNAALVEQAAAASGALQEQAESLSRAVSVFQLGEAPRRGHSAPPTRRKAAPARLGMQAG